MSLTKSISRGLEASRGVKLARTAPCHLRISATPGVLAGQHARPSATSATWLARARKRAPSSGSPEEPEDPTLETVQYAFDAAQDAAVSAIDTSQAAAVEAVDTSLAAGEEAVATTQDALQGAASVAQEAAAAIEDRLGQDAAEAYENVVASVGGSSSSPAASSSSSPSVSMQLAQPDPRFSGMKVLVAGATGGVGRRVVEQLTGKGVPVRALVRDTSRAAKLLPAPTTASLEVVRGDVYQYASLPSAAEGCSAIICCTGASDFKDPFGPFNVDYQGTLNLIAAAKAKGIKRFVLVTSIGTDEIINPLNLFWGVLFWKKRAEEVLQRSGLDYTIVRPGGLKNKLGPNESTAGSIVMKGPNYYGFPPKQSGSILRSQVAEVCLESLVVSAAEGKVVEIVAEKDAPSLPFDALFEGVQEW